MVSNKRFILLEAVAYVTVLALVSLVGGISPFEMFFLPIAYPLILPFVAAYYLKREHEGEHIAIRDVVKGFAVTGVLSLLLLVMVHSSMNSRGSGGWEGIITIAVAAVLAIVFAVFSAILLALYPIVRDFVIKKKRR